MRWCAPADRIIPGAPSAITSSTAVDADYPLANLHDGDPTSPTRWTTAAAARIVWDLGGGSPSVTIEGLLVVVHTLYEGQTLTVQGNATNAWGAPAFSQAITIGAYQGGLPNNVLVDLRATTLATLGYRYVSLLLPDHVTGGHAIGEVCWISRWTAPSVSAGWPVQRSDVRRISVNATSYGVAHVIDRGVRQRRLRLHFAALSDADRALWLALVREAGASLPWVLVLDVDPTTDFAASAEALYVRFAPEAIGALEESLIYYGLTDLDIDLLEVQRGLAL